MPRAVSRLILVLFVSLASLPAMHVRAQTTDDFSLRQRIEDKRTDARRTAGERSRERTNSRTEQRRRSLVRQLDRPVGDLRSLPIMPKTGRSSVVVTQ